MELPTLKTLKLNEIIDEVIISSTRDLFAFYGAEPSAPSLGSDGEGRQHAAVIGFSGGAIRGTFGIVVDAALLRFMTLQSGVSLRQDCADDLLGECANQLLGRIKNKLRCYGIMLAVSLPIVLRGIELSLATTTIDVWSHRFSTTKGSVSVWIDVRMADDALFEATNKGPLEGPLEGELLMFD